MKNECSISTVRNKAWFDVVKKNFLDTYASYLILYFIIYKQPLQFQLHPLKIYHWLT